MSWSGALTRARWARPLRVGALPIAVAVLAGGVPALAASPKVEPGCQTDRRAVVHTAAGTRSTAGTWTPCLLDTGMDTLETGLAVDRAGTIYRSATANPLGVAVSTDRGRTWQRRVLPEGAPSGISDGFVDPDTGRYFYVGAGDSLAYYTDDKGKSWKTGTFDSGQRQDWSKVFVGRPITLRTSGYRNNVYFCNLTVPLGVISTNRCYVSTNGGASFVTAGPDIPIKPCANAFLPSPALGRGVVDPRTGWVYMPLTRCGQYFVMVSKDQMKTWVEKPIPASKSQGLYAQAVVDTATNMPYVQQALSGEPNPVSAYLQAGSVADTIVLDGNGRLYAVWISDGYVPQLATSLDGGTTWTGAKPLAPKGVQGTLVSVAVTPQGRVGVSYYGTEDGGATWTGYLAVSDNATAANPVFQTATVSRPGEPLMDSPCCWAQGAQEYNVPRWAPDGTLYAAFAGYHESGNARGYVGRLVPRA